MGIFDKLKQGLQKTSQQLKDRLDRLDEMVGLADAPGARTREIDVDTAENLEEILLMADVGVAAAGAAPSRSTGAAWGAPPGAAAVGAAAAGGGADCSGADDDEQATTPNVKAATSTLLASLWFTAQLCHHPSQTEAFTPRVKEHSPLRTLRTRSHFGFSAASASSAVKGS